MEKRFQVFVSSTYEDLVAEREAVSLAILRSHNIPSGMEISSGANERTLDIIYRWIDDSDVFILLLGGRYGSVDESTGLSYTELEFIYAKSHNKPVIALILTDRYIDDKIASGAVSPRIAYERAHAEKLAKFKKLVSGDSFCIMISSIGELEPKIFAALDSVKYSYSPSGWIRMNTMLESLVDLYSRYTNCYLDILGKNVFSRREIEELLRILNEVIRNFISADIGWLDVMVPVIPTEEDAPRLLIQNVKNERGALKILFSSVRRTNPTTLIPIDVNGKPWRGSGNSFVSSGIDYVSTFRNCYSQDYGLPSDVASKIETQYSYWRNEHYFSSLLAVAILAPIEDSSRAVGVLNLNFANEAPLGVDNILSPQRSIAILNVLEPALRVLATAIERYIHRNGERQWRTTHSL